MTVFQFYVKIHLSLFWSPKLQELKEASVEAYKMWNICGRPRDGLLNRVKLESKYNALFIRMTFLHELSVLTNCRTMRINI